MVDYLYLVGVSSGHHSLRNERRTATFALIWPQFVFAKQPKIKESFRLMLKRADITGIDLSQTADGISDADESWTNYG